jgi:hypothetical protein
MSVDEKNVEGITPEQRKGVLEWIVNLPDEKTFLKWNYNSYGMIRGVNTGAAIADVYAEPYAHLYNAIPELVRNYEARVVQLEARIAVLEAALKPFTMIYRLDNMDLPTYMDDSAVYVAVKNEAEVLPGTRIIRRQWFREAADALAGK